MYRKKEEEKIKMSKNCRPQFKLHITYECLQAASTLYRKTPYYAEEKRRKTKHVTNCLLLPNLR